MAMQLKNGAIFLHIPKTGGNWVRSILERAGLVQSEIGHKHCDIDRVLFDPFLDKGVLNGLKRMLTVGKAAAADRPFTFCFVRHPLRWYESWFKYMSQPNRAWRDWPVRIGRYDRHPNAPLNGLGAEDFNVFIRNVLDKEPGFVTRMYASYTKRGVAFVGRQETIREDLLEILGILGVEVDKSLVLASDRVGVSETPKNPIGWDAELKQEMIRQEYSCLCQYNYDVDP